MLAGNIKIAVESLGKVKWRSLLTMLGIIIGVVSVVTTVSIGEGVKKTVENQITHIGSDVITIKPGKTVSRDAKGNITSVQLLPGLVASTLTEHDLATIQKIPNVRLSVPATLITAVPKTDQNELDSALVIGTTPAMSEILNQKLSYGNFFSTNDANRNVAVIGKSVAEKLFQENVPIGKEFTIRGQTFIVGGIFSEFQTNPLDPSANYNSAIFVPFNAGKQASGGTAQIFEVFVRPTDPRLTSSVVNSLQHSLLSAHGGQEDFTILRQSENLAVTSNVLNLLTTLIAGIAAISLVVGGIGIMNVMLVSVSERTHEIGIRKAIGATNRQILSQFLTEALVLSLAGGLIGILLSLVADFLIRVLTNLDPVVTLPVMFIATGVSLLVGIIFGSVPAYKAARKDPIEALRFE